MFYCACFHSDTNIPPLIAEIICVVCFITAQAADMGRAGSAMSDIACEKRK